MSDWLIKHKWVHATYVGGLVDWLSKCVRERVSESANVRALHWTHITLSICAPHRFFLWTRPPFPMIHAMLRPNGAVRPHSSGRWRTQQWWTTTGSLGVAAIWGPVSASPKPQHHGTCCDFAGHFLNNSCDFVCVAHMVPDQRLYCLCLPPLASPVYLHPPSLGGLHPSFRATTAFQ